MGVKKGARFEVIAKDFLERIFKEIGCEVVRSRNQNSGTQDGYDNLVEIVDDNNKSYIIYTECKDYTTQLNHSDAMEKIPHIVSTHKKIDLLLFISPFKDFSNPNETSKLRSFYETIAKDCPVAFITPEAFVSDYFSIYPDLYKALYHIEPEKLSEGQKYQLLNKFEKLIFSDKLLRKVVIDETRRKEFIGTLKSNEHHISRSFRRHNDEDPYRWDDPDCKLILEEELVKSKNGIVILGNPGFGKTSELKYLAVDLWEREKKGFIPKYESLRDFHSNSSIEDLLPIDYKYINRLLLILDGIDEVHDITDFTNKLRRFIKENQEIFDDRLLKIAISCRTNIYLNYIKTTEGLETLFLNAVSEGGAIKFLHKKFNIDLIDKKEFDFWRFRDVLQNPFYLELIGTSFKTDKKLILSRAKLIEAYIQLRLDEDFKEKYRNDISFEKEEQLHLAYKLAIAMEALQRSELKSNEIKAILEKDGNFSKNPFIEQNPSGTWSFEHKNIQEFLTAKTLSIMSFEEIIDFIRIDSKLNKTHPSWHNDISFLLNMEFEKQKFDKLVQWLILNDVELIFRADANRISDEIKNLVLQDTFQKLCVEATLWLADTTTIAKFSDTPTNIIYLLDKVKDTSLNMRARITATILLKEMSIGDQQFEGLKALLAQVIEEFKKDTELYIHLLGEVLNLVLATRISERNIILSIVITKLRDYDHREIVQAILKHISANDIADHLSYILEILTKVIKEKPWKYPSKYNTIISTKEKIFDLFCKIENPQLLLKIYKFITERHNSYALEEKQIESFYAHVTNIFTTNIKLVNKELQTIILDVIFNNKLRHFEDDLLIKLVTTCNIERALNKKILQKITIHPNSVHFLAGIANETLFGDVVKEFNSKAIGENFLISYRNIISSDDPDLAICLETKIEYETNYRYKLHTDLVKIEDDKAFYRENQQLTFDIKFDEIKLREHFQNIYNYIGIQELTLKDIEALNKVYYHSISLQKQINEYAKSLVNQILHEKFKGSKKLAIKDITKTIRLYEFERMEDILNELPNTKTDRIKVSEQQKNYIEKWCNVNQSFALTFFKRTKERKKSYSTMRVIYGFQKHFRFSLNEELLLNMIWQSADHERLNLEFIEGIVDKKKINEFIFRELQIKNLAINNKYLLLRYISENGLDLILDDFEIKHLITDELLLGNSHYSMQIIKLYYSEDMFFLKHLLSCFYMKLTHKYFILFLLNLLNKANENIYIEDFLIKNYSDLKNMQIMDEGEIISFLLGNNSKFAFGKLRTILAERVKYDKPIISKYHRVWESYTNPASIDDLLDIITLYLSNEIIEGVFDSDISAVRVATDSLVSIGRANDEFICSEILEKISLRKFNIDKDDDAVFYLNMLNRDLEAAICTHKSKPYPLSETVDIIKKYKYLMI